MHYNYQDGHYPAKAPHYQTLAKIREEIKKLCYKDCYNLILHKHLGDNFYLILARKKFEEIYGAKLHFIIRPQHEFLMKFFNIVDYDIYDLDSFVNKNNDLKECFLGTPDVQHQNPDWLHNEVFLSIFPGIPVIGEPFVCVNVFHWFIMYANYWCYIWPCSLGLDTDYLFSVPNPPRGLSIQVKKKLASIAPLNKIVLFAPEAATTIEIPVQFWNIIAEHVHAQGYTVLVNSQKYRLAHGISAFDLGLSLEDVVALGLSCAGVFGLRSGLCDVLVGAGDRLFVVYPSELRREMGSLNVPFAFPTGVHEILLHNWQITGNIVWEGKDLTPALQKQVKAWHRWYLKEKWQAFFSVNKSSKQHHRFWKRIWEQCGGQAKHFPVANKNILFRPEPEKITFGPFPIYERSYVSDRVKTSVLGGLLHKVRHNDRSCRLHLFGLCVYSRRFTLFRTTRVLGVTIQKKPWRDRLIEEFTRQLEPARHKVYLLPYHIGETYVFLAHAESWLKGDHGDIQVAVWQKNQLPLYRMFLPADIPLVSISMGYGQQCALFGSEPVTAGEFTVFSADAHIDRTLLAGLRNTGSGDFYAHIKAVLQAGDQLPRPPRIAPAIKSMVDDVLDGFGMKPRFAVLLPEANCSMPLAEEFWQKLAHGLQRKGYGVIVNGSLALDGAKTCKLPIDAFYELASRSAGMVSLASGMAVLLSATRVKMDVLYTAFKKKFPGYTSSVALACYSLRHIEGVLPETVREWDTDEFSLDSIQENILARY